MFFPLFIQLFAVILGLAATIFVFIGLLLLRKKSDKQTRKHIDLGAVALVIAVLVFVLADVSYPINFAMPPTMHAMTHDGKPASLPFFSALNFLFHENNIPRVQDIGRDPNDVPVPIGNRAPATIKISVTAKEVISEIAPGIFFNYWTYDGSVPGPMYRVLVGDTVELSLTNDQTSLHPHNIDLHAVTGPGGGAAVTNVEPGETKTFRWQALNPGLYEYHCAMPNVSTHNSHGQYGLILVEPTGGLAPVDKEFYVMQGELYTRGEIGKKGLVVFNSKGLIDGDPTYVTMNGRIENTPRMKAQVGDRVRMYVGNGGVNLVSSLHLIGEIFDVVYPEAAIGEGSAIYKNVQTTTVLPGGATIVEFTVNVPGKYLLVDHALARMNKGAWAVLEVTGPENPDIFTALPSESSSE
ncbi:MAG: multicopper oxidase domain-containing protein [Patescibacteria group bacterium]|jgi:nitrite reductase (NO-forming)